MATKKKPQSDIDIRLGANELYRSYLLGYAGGFSNTESLTNFELVAYCLGRHHFAVNFLPIKGADLVLDVAQRIKKAK